MEINKRKAKLVGARVTRSRSMYSDTKKNHSTMVEDAMIPKQNKNVNSARRSFESAVDEKRPRCSPTENVLCENGNEPEDPEVREIIRQMEEVRDILGRDYVNVVARLKMNWIPPCVGDQHYCRSHHHRKCPRPKFIDDLQKYAVGTLSKHNRVLHYLRTLQDMCVKMEFPGEDALKNVLDMILNSKQPEDSPYTTKYILQYAITVAETILMKFPPCWPDIHRAYRKFLSSNVDMQSYYKNSAAGSTSKPFFTFLLDSLLETMMTCEPINDPASRGRRDSESSESEKEFHAFIEKTAVEENFSLYSRQEKLDRIFFVLNILTKMFEYDLSIWLLRYLSKTEKVINSENGPLLALVFFDGSYNLMTAPVKKFLEIFVLSVHLRFPSDKLEVLSRIMSLLSVAVGSCEHQTSDKLIYPNIGFKIKTFTRELFKTIQDKIGCLIVSTLSVIKQIKVSDLRYLLIDQLLRKLDKVPEEMNVKKIFDLFDKERWTCTEGRREEQKYTDEQKYTLMSPKKSQPRPKADPIFRHEYLDIVLDCLRAYCDTFRIREVICRAFAKNPKARTPIKSTPIKPKKSLDKLRLDLVEEDIEELEKAFNYKQTFRSRNLEVLPYSDIDVDGETLLRYRDDIKYLGKLLIHVKTLYKSGNRDYFEEWFQFLNNILSTTDI